MTRALRAVVAIAIVASGVLPLLLVIKQAVTAEVESFAWPPVWLPMRGMPLTNDLGSPRLTE